jgi:hypothetical protein
MIKDFTGAPLWKLSWPTDDYPTPSSTTTVSAMS